MTEYHRRFLALVDEVERAFPVAEWHVGDVPVWPLARATLYTDLYQLGIGKPEYTHTHAAPRGGLVTRIGRAAADAATPLTNIWRHRSDLRHLVLAPHRADALFVGDGVSLDCVNGAWQDRFCDPLIERLHADGASTLLMQRGDGQRLPWSRPTFAANTIVHRGRLLAGLRRSAPRQVSLPDHEGVVRFLAQNGAPILGLNATALRDKAVAVSATASAFEQVLKIVRPSLCFVVGYFWGMGHALALACRRRGILSIELQREGRSAQHEAYIWSTVPEQGYAILPAVFWTWTDADAAAIDAWTKKLKQPWHRGILGGQPQLASWFDDDHPVTRATDAMINEVRASAPAEREILVALQAVDGYEAEWNALAAFIETGASHWRWWLRRHPSTVHLGDRGMGRLPSLRRPNVVIDLPSSVPLPALLRHMDAVVSATSGAAVEASMFGVKPFFISPEAREFHPHLIETGQAEIVTDMNTLAHRLRSIPSGRGTGARQPDLSGTLSQLTAMAHEYRELCKSH